METTTPAAGATETTTPPTSPRTPTSVDVLGASVPRVSLPILWWLQARTRANVLEKRLKDAKAPPPPPPPRAEPDSRVAEIAALEAAVDASERRAAAAEARAQDAEARSAALDAALAAREPTTPTTPRTPEGERRLKGALRDADARLDELRRGTLQALRAAETKLAAKDRELEANRLEAKRSPPAEAKGSKRRDPGAHRRAAALMKIRVQRAFRDSHAHAGQKCEATLRAGAAPSRTTPSKSRRVVPTGGSRTRSAETGRSRRSWSRRSRREGSAFSPRRR